MESISRRDVLAVSPVGGLLTAASVVAAQTVEGIDRILAKFDSNSEVVPIVVGAEGPRRVVGPI
jgi:hypothetical protein